MRGTVHEDTDRATPCKSITADYNGDNAMAFVPVPFGAQVEIRGTLHGSQVENVLWFRGAVEWSAGALGTLCTDVATAFTTEVLPVMSSDYTFREVYATAQFSRTGPFSVAVSAGGITGGIASSARNAAESLCMKLLTENRGRSYRGRLYQMAIPSSQLDDSRWSEATLTTFVERWNNFRTLMSDLDRTWSVCSRYSGGAARAAGILTPITLVSVTDNVVDSQRRRKPNVGQ